MNNEYTKERTSAILTSLKIAQKLQEEHPEIAGMYLKGMTQPQIVEELKVDSKYLINKVVARSAVGAAIRGYSGNEIYRNFEGLLPESELERVSKEHVKNNGRMSLDDGKGLFSLNQKKRLENASLGGKKAYGEGLGIHGLATSEKEKISREGVEARGDVCWKEGFYKGGRQYPGEMEYAFQLAEKEEYQHLRGKPNWKLIVQEINSVFHDGKEVRTQNAIKKQACKEKKAKK